jgi:ubiquitin conjugation factor E4 B
MIETARSLRTASVLATNTLGLLHALVKEEGPRSVLLRPEMVERLAHSVNYYVEALGGGSRRERPVVRGALRFSFVPERWLELFIDIYLALAAEPAFLGAVVNDERCFSVAMLQKAASSLSAAAVAKSGASAPTAMERAREASFADFISRTEQAWRSRSRESECLGDVPEEFLDPLLRTVMKDPVLLPSSGMVLDRSVIARHLLSDSLDPFSRKPLTLDELQPQAELRQRIEAFLEEERKRNLKQ